MTLRPTSAVIVEFIYERSIKVNQTCKLKCQLLRNEDDDSDSRMDKMEELRRRFERLGTHKASPRVYYIISVKKIIYTLYEYNYIYTLYIYVCV